MIVTIENNSTSILESLVQIYKQIRLGILQSTPITLVLKTGSGKKIEICNINDNKKKIVKFYCTLIVIKAIITNLLSKSVTTKRDIYYQNVLLFKSQRASNNLIDMISTSLEVETGNLGIHPSQKGLMYKIQYSEPLLVPTNYLIEDFACLKLVVVIEKDAVFKNLASTVTGNTNYLDVLFVTGKGFPDFLTKNFVKSLALKLNIPVLGFMDSDVFGYNIFKTYKYINSENISNQYRFEGCFVLDFNRGFTNLSLKDYKMSITFLQTLSTIMANSEDKLEIAELQKWQRDIQRSLVLHKKNEMNLASNGYILDKVRAFLSRNFIDSPLLKSLSNSTSNF